MRPSGKMSTLKQDIEPSPNQNSCHSTRAPCPGRTRAAVARDRRSKPQDRRKSEARLAPTHARLLRAVGVVRSSLT